MPKLPRSFRTLGIDPVGMCGADFSAFIRNKYKEYDRTIQEANVKAE